MMSIGCVPLCLVLSVFVPKSNSVISASRTKYFYPNSDCSSSKYLCENRRCIEKSWYCDGGNDCGDYSDEKYCDHNHQCPSHYPFMFCGNNRCIPELWRCDGINDCSDGRDEVGCTGNWDARTYPPACRPNQYWCKSGQCVSREKLCDRSNYDCSDNSDEIYCGKTRCDWTGYDECPEHYPFFKCPDFKCIPETWVCDGYKDCKDGYDENICGGNKLYYVFKRTQISIPEARVTGWLWKQGNSEEESRIDIWGENAHRLLIALHFAKPTLFGSTSDKWSQLVYEVELRLLEAIYRDSKGDDDSLPPDELAVFINSLLVACIDPRNFHGINLVEKLRRKVSFMYGHTNPLLLLSLCNSDDEMTDEDVAELQRILQHPVDMAQLDVEASALMALSCVRKKKSFLERDIYQFARIFARKQYEDGSFGSLTTTALALQAFIATTIDVTDVRYSDLNLKKAVQFILDKQSHDGKFESFLSTYYVMPVLKYNSLADISASHCRPLEPHRHDEWTHKLADKVTVKYTLLHKENQQIIATLKFQTGVNRTFFDVMQIAPTLDERYRFSYFLKNNKPYIYTLNNIENNPETGKYWYLHQYLTSSNVTSIIDSSPIDVIVKDGEHYSMWYRSSNWKEQMFFETATEYQED